MNSHLSVLNRIFSLNIFHKLKKVLKSQSSGIIFTSALHNSLKSLLTVVASDDKPDILLLFPELKELQEVSVELNILGKGDIVVAIDSFEKLALQEKLSRISRLEKKIILSTYNILNYKFPSIEKLKTTFTKIEGGKEISYDDLIEYLSLLDYERDNYVTEPGQFAMRGAIVDFWSYSESRPCRVEFDGDFIESIRYFDEETQRTLNYISEVSLASKLEESDNFTENIIGILGEPLVVANGGYLIEKLKRTADEELTPNEKEKMNADDTIEKTDEPEEEAEEPDLTEMIKAKWSGALWLIEGGVFGGEKRLELNIKSAPNVNSSFKLLFNYLQRYTSLNYSVVITAENEIQTSRLKNLLIEYNEELEDLIFSGKILLEVLPIKKGFLDEEDKFLLLTDYEIFNKPFRRKIPGKHRTTKSKAREFARLKYGDYVVHENFGIGKYAGLEKIKIGLSEQETIKILYAEGDIVYVNLNYLGLVKKYSSGDNPRPRLTRLGSGEWKSTKRRVKKKIKDAARDLIKLYAKRKSSKGFPFSRDTIWQKELEASFLYEDTPDQSRVTGEVKSDMESETPMDRLVCGDVGFGKTEIAVRAAFKAVNDSKQVCMLVPTTILAEQHFNTFRDRLSPYPVKIGMLSRFRTKKEQAETIKGLKDGSVDIVIGTHRLLSSDVEFKDLGLLIIDEEHKFGVIAKEKLKKMKVNVDTLTLTATPIPRTLNMSLLGARDLSIISTPPPNRQPVYTEVAKFEIGKIRQWILRELSRGGQVYFVHDRVNSIEKIARYLQHHVPEARIGIAHGQMKSRQLEKVIHDFLNKKFDVLITTKIIESGIDIPSVNTIIINRADRFGLAELHQLRGRVGRSNKQAYAFFVVPSLNSIGRKALKRLESIEEYSDLGEGFNLSMRDLEIRGAGNLLGTEQSGAIDSVGFELYLKMIDEAVEELKRDEFEKIFDELPKVQERTNPTIDSYFNVNIPESYMPAQEDRLGFYSSMFSLLRIEELKEIKEEMKDRFGRIPQVVERLFLTAELKYYASLALFGKITLSRKSIIFMLPEANNEVYYHKKFQLLMELVFKKYSALVKFKQSKKAMYLTAPNNFKSPESAILFAINFSREVSELFDQNRKEAEKPVK